MVSYPDSSSADRSLPIRRPPSVSSHSSRASTVRRHRHNRSQYGGTTLQPQNEFPVFTHTGDVEIVISNGRKEARYLLHKLILTQCSGFFEAATSDEWATAGEAAGSAASGSAALARLPSGARPKEKRKWRYELDWGNSDDDLPMLVQKSQRNTPTMFGGGGGGDDDDATSASQPPPARNKPVAPQSGFFRSMANFSTLHVPPSVPHESDPDDDTFRDYDNLFRIFYNYPPSLDSVNIASAYVECKSLLQLADMYDALGVIGPRVDHHLLRFQGRLWKQIAKYPPSYLKLGYMARSKAIFAEAMVHVVGQWPQGINQLRGQIADPVIELIEDKVDEIDELKLKIEVKLFRLSLTTSRGDRVSPSSNWLDWMAVSLFRQWLAENTTPPPAPILKSPRALATSRHGTSSAGPLIDTARSSVAATAPPPPPAFNTGRIFRLLGQGGNTYLGHDECKRFLRLSPDHYSRENLKRFERRVDEIKNKAKDAVRPVMRNFLELDLKEGGLPYLTCTRVEPQDFPWDE
ncbi:hypothetical protein IAQ61_010037 [Plenodomus lingam]|uniref:BTB domain-containing protein n=1 Tax=Leptosphaeria maculans (strain JN3 / isolate v23.1.3 / race Av1-4-5-6-7-8) TaxID=985895 RepID=E5AEU2_LEPMJ|nr:hypothetical protein LEMA_P005180.1 [Plenodomus lingam JN3]KAH9862619.1 hypothetical protein IAQ61_010037 [Plenodomus lingam]CBY01731.1 hypothetical protein LEMA_P005180.1 [Plenodomus lingam JN3]